ncbi:MAG: TraR/DksA C4-type zinc finger protein [Verrucomicrobiota bacterium]|nr:TraR/DksA C4-type zinc finger protein [Verrucomicrobiota bacterium]
MAPRHFTQVYSFNYMEADRITYFRERLEDLAKEISKDLSASKDSADIVKLDTSIGRLSRMDAMQNQQMALELRRRQENQLLRIQNALKRMDEGRYGLCGKCKKPIAEERLETSPDVVMCVRCA